MCVRESEKILCQGCQTQTYIGQSASGTSGRVNVTTTVAPIAWSTRFPSFTWPTYSLGSASDKGITVQEDSCKPLPDLCRHVDTPQSSSVKAVNQFLNIYELQRYVKKWTVQQVTHVPGRVSALLTFISPESNQHKVPHSFFSVSRHGNMTPCQWCIVRTRLKNKGVNADCTGWRMIQRIQYIFVVLYSWMVPEVLADLLRRPKPAAFCGCWSNL